MAPSFLQPSNTSAGCLEVWNMRHHVLSLTDKSLTSVPDYLLQQTLILLDRTTGISWLHSIETGFKPPLNAWRCRRKCYSTPWFSSLMSTMRHAVQPLGSRLSSEYSRGFDKFIKQPCYLCTVTHKAMVSQDYPGGHCMWMSVWFSDSSNHAVAAQPGNHFEITALLPYHIEFNVMHAYECRKIAGEGCETLKGGILHSCHIVFNSGRTVGIPLHFTPGWK